ncbi:MAG: hypothetical protein ACRYFX_18790 [Janthinobacterium lividum]
MSKKEKLLARLNEELQGLYMVGALCSSDYMFERVTWQVTVIMRAKRRIEALRPVGLWFRCLAT